MQLSRKRRVWIVAALALIVIGVVAYRYAVGRWTDHQYRLALQALERCDFNEAAERLETYLAQRPSDAQAHLLAGQTARRRGLSDQATRHLQQARKLGAKAKAVDDEEVLLEVQGGRWEHVDKLIAVCMRDPRSAEAAIILEALIEAGMQPTGAALAFGAVQLWLEHRTAALDQARGYCWRGRLEELRAAFPEAYADYRKAVKLAPDYVPARIAVASAVLRDNPDQAAAEFEWLRQHAPKDPTARFLIARWRRHLGQPEEAGRILDDLLTTEPNMFIALVERGRVAIDLKRPQDAEPWLTRAVELAPEQREVNAAMADCLRLMGRFDEAQRFEEKVLRIVAELKTLAETLSKDPGPAPKK